MHHTEVFCKKVTLTTMCTFLQICSVDSSVSQVMKIKEDLIAQEPKHREAMEEVGSDVWSRVNFN